MAAVEEEVSSPSTSKWNVFARRRKPSKPAAPLGSNGQPLPTSPSLSRPPIAEQRRPRRRSSSAAWNLLTPRFFEADEEEHLHPLLTAQFSNPKDVAAFAEALRDDAGQVEHLTTDSTSTSPATAEEIDALAGGNVEADSSSRQEPPNGASSNLSARSPAESSRSTSRSHSQSNLRAQVQKSLTPKVGRISAASDFAPVRERTTSRRRSKKAHSGAAEGFLYKVLRFPLLVVIWATILLQFLAYLFVRQCVNVIEYLVAWRGRKGQLRKKLRRAANIHEWQETAEELDEFLEFEAWKDEDASGLYDWRLVKKVSASLKAFREKDDTENLLGVLDLCLRNNFAGIENFRLYSETYYGTKRLIEAYLAEAYLAEAERAMDYVRHTNKISLENKRSFYRTVSKNMGKSALCLSGGGSFGYYHIGLVRALLDSDLLPNIITGTSAGGLIAALACTRTNEELKHILVPELADRITACEESIRIWGPRAWKTGARFDTVKWAEKSQFFTLGSLTFLEAYRRTGKVLNISVIPADRHSPVKLLNYITAPNCIIWSALLASAAVPGIMNPVCLMQKTKDGEAVPWNWGHRFKDGSLRVDIPLQDLHNMFNVVFPIVSQVNPHVHLFFFSSRGQPGRPVVHRKGKGWRGGFILSAAEHVIKLHLVLNFKIVRDLDLLPPLLGQDWSGVFLQSFSGACTVWPRTRAWDWVRILSDPDRKELARMMNIGKSVTFPKIHMIGNRRRLERAIEEGRQSCRRALRAQTAAASSAMNTPADGMFSTSAEAAASRGANLSDESYNGGSTSAVDFFSSKRLRGAAAQFSDEGGITPGEPIDTPGELPRHVRLRSAAGDLASKLKPSWVTSPRGDSSEGEDDETVLDVSASVKGRPRSKGEEVLRADYANGSNANSTGYNTPRDANGPLTAAALSPRPSPAGTPSWDQRGSIRAGGASSMRWHDEEDESSGSSAEDDL